MPIVHYSRYEASRYKHKGHIETKRSQTLKLAKKLCNDGMCNIVKI